MVDSLTSILSSCIQSGYWLETFPVLGKDERQEKGGKERRKQRKVIRTDFLFWGRLCHWGCGSEQRDGNTSTSHAHFEQLPRGRIPMQGSVNDGDAFANSACIRNVPHIRSGYARKRWGWWGESCISQFFRICCLYVEITILWFCQTSPLSVTLRKLLKWSVNFNQNCLELYFIVIIDDFSTVKLKMF